MSMPLNPSMHSLNSSTFSSDIAHAVSRGAGEGVSPELPVQTTADFLSEMARKGSVSAAVALERVLRPGEPPEDWDDELDRILS